MRFLWFRAKDLHMQSFFGTSTFFHLLSEVVVDNLSLYLELELLPLDENELAAELNPLRWRRWVMAGLGAGEQLPDGECSFDLYQAIFKAIKVKMSTTTYI